MTGIALNPSMADDVASGAVGPAACGVAAAGTTDIFGLQMSTVHNLLMAWVVTLPAAICLSAGVRAPVRTCSEYRRCGGTAAA